MKYFKNKTEKECFFTSLANLLLEKFKDEKTAAQIYENYGCLPLVREGGGTYQTLWHFYVSELSNGRYSGRVFVDSDDLKATRNIIQRKHSQEEFLLYSDIVEKGLLEKKIDTSKEYEKCCMPVIVAIKAKGDKGSAWHTTVLLSLMPNQDLMNVIDNGKCCLYNISAFDFLALMDVEKQD